MGHQTGTAENCELPDVEDFQDALKGVFPPALHQRRLLAMLHALDEWLGAAGVPYWITGGTLVGALRHGVFIPHDDDVDIEMLASDLPRAQAALQAVGRSFRWGGEWTGKCERPVPMGRFFFWDDGGQTTASVDVFLRESSLDALQEFPSAAEIFPLQRLPFHNISVAAPARPDAFLGRCYAPSWATDVVVWGHSSRGRLLLHRSIEEYKAAVEALGYERPCAQATAEKSLSAVDLSCPGDLKDLLWELHGWASPYMQVCADDDPGTLELLGLEVRRLSVRSAPLAALLRAGGRGAEALLSTLKERSGAQVSAEGVHSGTEAVRVKAVGTPEEIEALVACFLKEDDLLREGSPTAN